MTNDEAKLQAIKNAYKKNWVNLEKYHIKDGWFEMYDLVTESDFIELNENDFDIIGGECRLKQLQGIENNNGWIKIESENDLPNHDIYCHFMSGKYIYNGLYDKYLQGFYNGLDKIIGVTHYQPIKTPPKPIF